MIRFVDIETGNVFNGEYPYIFWLENGQAVNLIYNKPICFISHAPEIEVSLSKNDVFKLLNLKSWENDSYDLISINNFNYIDINDLYFNGETMKLIGVPHNNYFVYLFYISVSSASVGEYINSFFLSENGEIKEYKIGADFYGENEFNNINLLNNGIDIPDSIQKALYTVNVHEDKKDNITLNRKWKELLSNYWDVIANKGSYKSLYNSLKWFEYGDVIKLQEIWEHEDLGKKIYEERSIKEILSDKYFESLNGFSKTTYISINAALEKIVKEDNIVQYDDEKNPKIESLVQKWSVQDLSLKLSMLGNFYKTYFMPIHLQCIKSTIEDIVYSNTIKLFNASAIHREDIICYTEDIKCNVKNGEIFRLKPINARVGKDTLFGNQYNKTWIDYNSVDIIGVQRKDPYFYTGDNMNTQIKTYLAQHFNSIGVIIDFELEIPLSDGDFIKRSTLTTLGDQSNNWIVLEDYRIIKNKKISFSLLCTKEKEYNVKFEFFAASGKNYVKNVKFHVIDTQHTCLKLYKVQNIKIPDINNEGSNEYVFGRMLENYYNMNKDQMLYKQYIPAMNVNPHMTSYWNYNGICLNHMIIFKSNKPLSEDTYIKKNYFTLIREINNNLIYTICLSKRFGFEPNYANFASYKIYREEYIFFPGFHELVEFGTDYSKTGIDKYTITDQDALCVIPELSYGKLIEEAQWEFVNVSDPSKPTIVPLADIKEPFIAPDEKTLLKPGYYNIIFRYRLSGENQINTIELNSAFLKK